MKLAVRQHNAAVAILRQSRNHMGHHDHVGAVAPAFEFLVAAPLKTDVADSCHLVDQLHLELDGHRQAESEALKHAGRIFADRHVDIAANLREVLDIIKHLA